MSGSVLTEEETGSEVERGLIRTATLIDSSTEVGWGMRRVSESMGKIGGGCLIIAYLVAEGIF